MDDMAFAGPLLRMLRLERNWSQETLCSGVCAVSYLSKIEQGRAQPNENLLYDLFAKLGIQWQPRTPADTLLIERAYEAFFSGDTREMEDCTARLSERWEQGAVGPDYLDLMVLLAYCGDDASGIPEPMKPLLDARQRCLLELASGAPEQAMRQYPCALTVLVAGAAAYREGNYTLALGYLQRAYDLACQNGYAHLMMDSQVYMANCYSDLRNAPAMESHSAIAGRLARALGAAETERVINYNRACTQMECGDYEAGYAFFSALKSENALDLHKLAICCEKLGKDQEAMDALDGAEKDACGVEADMCRLVRYRLTHPDYLRQGDYGTLLLDTFHTLRRERPVGYARFHLPWVEEWCTANRQYRMIYEIMRDFT